LSIRYGTTKSGSSLLAKQLGKNDSSMKRGNYGS
jgi:hypothetical protein